MLFDGGGDALHAGFEDAARHGEIQTHKALGVADEEGVAALEQDARLVGEEAAEVVQDRKSTRLNSSHPTTSRMPSSA